MIQIILNADDFGLTEGVCAGIVRAIQSGGVTATSAMVCAPGALERVARWAPRIHGRAGAHLQLTAGTPILDPDQVPSLVGGNGAFPANRQGIRSPKYHEILAEWQAQVEALLLVGIYPTHLDTHHHLHGIPEAFEAIAAIGRRYGIPVRPVRREMRLALRAAAVSSVDRSFTRCFRSDRPIAEIKRVLLDEIRDLAAPAVFELVCHPGIADDDLRAVSEYADGREIELAELCDPRLRPALVAAGLTVCGFHAVRDREAVARLGS